LIDLDINLLLKKFSIEIATLIYTGQVHIHLITQGAMRVCTVRICITGKNDHTVKTVPKSNRQIVEMEAKSKPLTHASITAYLVQHLSKT
jgi:hypothetical protein